MNATLTTEGPEAEMARGGRRKPRSGPERRCIVTGESGPTDRLIRFVLAPDGEVVPDLAARLPGRGVWVTAERGALETAVRRNHFARAFRAPARVPDGLVAKVEEMLARRLIERLAMARKAGQAVVGFEKVRARLRSGGVGALVTAADAAADGRDKLRRLAPEAPRIEVLDSAELGLAFGRDFAIHAALDAGGIADRAIAEAGRLAGFRPGPAILALPRQAAAQRDEQPKEEGPGGPGQDD